MALGSVERHEFEYVRHGTCWFILSRAVDNLDTYRSASLVRWVATESDLAIDQGVKNKPLVA